MEHFMFFCLFFLKSSPQLLQVFRRKLQLCSVKPDFTSLIETVQRICADEGHSYITDILLSYKQNYWYQRNLV